MVISASESDSWLLLSGSEPSRQSGDVGVCKCVIERGREQNIKVAGWGVKHSSTLWFLRMHFRVICGFTPFCCSSYCVSSVQRTTAHVKKCIQLKSSSDSLLVCFLSRYWILVYQIISNQNVIQPRSWLKPWIFINLSIYFSFNLSVVEKKNCRHKFSSSVCLFYLTNNPHTDTMFTQAPRRMQHVRRAAAPVYTAGTSSLGHFKQKYYLIFNWELFDHSSKTPPHRDTHTR